MAFEIDTFLDRRALRRKVSFWRIGALLALAVAIVSILAASGVLKGFVSPPDHIARVPISGVITEDRPMLKMLETIRKDKTVKAVILAIDSPGGTTVGGEAMFEAVRKLAEEKPVATSVGTLAASAGYMIATASDHIVARRSSIVGSIGVIFQYPQASELLDKIGIEVKEIKSAPLKAEPSPFNPTPPEAEVAMRVLIDDSYRWFVDLVTDRRPLSRDEVMKLADGRVFSGDRGVSNKLIDAIGGEDAAKAWLVEQKGIDKELELRDWKPVRSENRLLFSSASLRWIATKLGLPIDASSTEILPDIIEKHLFLDGLLSIWQHPSSG